MPGRLFLELFSGPLETFISERVQVKIIGQFQGAVFFTGNCKTTCKLLCKCANFLHFFLKIDIIAITLQLQEDISDCVFYRYTW